MSINGHFVLLMVFCGSCLGGCGEENGKGGGDFGGRDTTEQDSADLVTTADLIDVGITDTPRGSIDIGNRPPLWDPLPGVTIMMGASGDVDLSPYFADPEDNDSVLTLSWSARHVAIQDLGSGVVRFIGPVDWHGVELVPITVWDTGGLSDTEQIAVTVEFVDVVSPGDVSYQETIEGGNTEDLQSELNDWEVVEEVNDWDVVGEVNGDTSEPCGWVVFQYEALAGATVVSVSGSFNSWGSPGWILTDADGDNVWEYGVQLSVGEHQYKFIVDGTWLIDPKNPQKVNDGYGGFNSVLNVEPCN